MIAHAFFTKSLDRYDLFSFGQNLSGIYSTVGQRIIISDDSLKLEFIGQPGVLGWTLAETTFKWVNKNFIEINSTPPYVLIREGMIIEQFMDSTITDSLKLSFSFPNYSSNYYYNKTPLDVSIYASLEIGYKDFNFSYSEKNKEFILPFEYPQKYYEHLDNKVQCIDISILNPIYDGELDGSFYGVRRVSIVSYYPIEKNVNHISIEIPAIDDAFFEKYYVKGEYAKVSKDSISWKGEVFVKEK